MAAPRAEVDIDATLVAALLRDQHPDLSDRPVRPLAEGWDNATFRFGDHLVARLPRRAAAVPLVLNELRWLATVGAGLPLPVPVPIRSGRPGCGYPWPWSIGPWLPGLAAELTPPTDLDAAAALLGRFLAALHRPAPADAPVNPYRGVPLPARDRRLREGLDRLGVGIDPERILTCWIELRDTPPWSGPRLWLHGDLHPLNVLVHRGRLSGVIDFGDLAAGDPACDLAVAWMMFTPRSRGRFRYSTGADDATWRRALGWALALGVALANGDDRLRVIGIRTLHNALADQP